MTTFVYLTAIILMVMGLAFGVRFFVRAYVRYRDSRMITCPGNGEAAIVEVDAVHAALTSALGRPDIRLQNCWRWPIEGNCGQECLLQLDVAPEKCLVQGVLRRWYNYKACVFCGSRFHQIYLTDHQPALQSSDGKLVEWKEVPIKDLPTVMATYKPVCWDCYIAQSFRLEHPELVVYRPWRDSSDKRNQGRPGRTSA